ncbi:MAG: FAD-binding oxidoreductase [Sphingomonadales bacterium]|nr:FAD-binding oxidoreductase [Sphingomonadales bacterium]
MSAERLSALKAVYSGRIFIDDADKAPFLTDWRGLWTGNAIAVVQPASTEEVAAIMRWARDTGSTVTPQGGNTGLSGGSVPEAGADGILLSLTRLNRIRSIDPANNSMVVEAGCLLSQVQAAAEQADRLFPLSLAAEGSCTIGGNLASNAGGTGVLRYGNARELCLGLEVVTAVAAVDTPTAAVDLLALLQSAAGDGLTAFELVSDLCVQLVLDHTPGTRLPLEERARWYVLIEVSDALSEERAAETLQNTLMAAFDRDIVLDVAIATSMRQSQDFWALRENVSEAQSVFGKTIKHDVSLPISDIPAFIGEAITALSSSYPDVQPVVFGHLGDGNLHFNVSPANGSAGYSLLERQERINRTIHDLVVAHGGSISAEHGLGVLRRDEAAQYKQPVEIALMRAVKTALDPHGLLNPNKLLRASNHHAPL